MKKSKRIKKAKQEIELIAKKYGFKIYSMDVIQRDESYTLRSHMALDKKTNS